ncbi:MAG: D-alanyl-D-alanine carboxypeptidase/D-alanyl-D-alanine-endopeptidase [Limisphaerales bacterium]
MTLTDSFNRVRRAAVLVIAACFAFGTQAAPKVGAKTREQLASQIDGYINQRKFAAAAWGVKVASTVTGLTLYQNHADRLLSPASNTKLYTGALGLVRFGGQYRVATPIFATSRPDANGILRGDLMVSGRGDWSWNSRRLGTNFWDVFAPFVNTVASNGVRQITGEIIGDATYFRGEPTGSSWTIDDLREGEAAEISPLALDDNVMQVSVTPGPASGQPCLVTPLQPGTGLIFSNQTVTVASSGSGRIEAFRPSDGKVVFLVGTAPAGSGSQMLDVPVPEPATWFAAGLKMALARHGITVAGQARGVAWPRTPSWDARTLVKLGEVVSPPLRAMVRDFMKPSQNLEADTLLWNVGEAVRSPDTPSWISSEALGLTVLRGWLKAANIPAADVQFDEGSGLSRNNLTTANATVALLQFMARNPEGQDFMESLPIGGVDGSLRYRFEKDAGTRNVRAKTGTLRWVSALSGYVNSAAGDRLAFSIMLNRFEPARGHAAREEVDAVALMLANFAGHSNEAK